MKRFPRSSLLRVLSLAGLCAALFPLGARAQSAARLTSVVSLSRPMAASEALGLQRFLGSPGGAPLLEAHPGLNILLRLDVSNEPRLQAHLQALGPLSARLPADLATRDAAAAREAFSQAYGQSGQDAVGEIDVRALTAVESAAADEDAWRGLASAATDLKPYSLYGRVARERVRLFAQKAAAVRSRAFARNLALELQTGTRGPESSEGVRAGLVDESSFARGRSRLAKHVPAAAPVVPLTSVGRHYHERYDPGMMKWVFSAGQWTRKTVVRSEGIYGAHEESAFREALGKIQGREEASAAVPGFDGMRRVKYRLFAEERGVPNPKILKNQNYYKTVVDGEQWPARRLEDFSADLRRELARSGQNEIEGVNYVVYLGVRWAFWIRGGRLESFGVDDWPGMPMEISAPKERSTTLLKDS